MAFPLFSVLTAAPGIISAATDLMRLVRERKSEAQTPAADQADARTAKRIAELESLLEKQAELIEELAVSQRDLALAARNNRIFGAIALLIAVVALAALLVRL